MTAIEYHDEGGTIIDREWLCCELCMARERKALVAKYSFEQGSRTTFFRSDDLLTAVITESKIPLLANCTSCGGMKHE